MFKISAVVLAIVFATICTAFIPAVKNLGSVATKSSRINVKSDLNMMFGMFKGASSSSAASAKKVCVITGTTSGLGKETTRALLNKGDYYVICACRDVEKMNQVAAAEGFNPDRCNEDL
jgi:hypothetical protein